MATVTTLPHDGICNHIVNTFAPPGGWTTKEDREDLLQEARIAAWEAAEKFEADRGMLESSWVFEAVVQRCIRLSGRRSDREFIASPVVASTDAAIGGEDERTLLDSYADPTPSPEALFDEAERLDRMRGVIGKLPAGQRAVMLALLEGKSLRDIAADDGCGKSTVFDTFADGAAKVRRAMGGAR